MHPLVYLTGTPASGKTTVCEAIKAALPRVHILEYSELLAAHLGRKHSRQVEHCELRESSAVIITPADVAAVDDFLISHAADLRRTHPVVVASHPATRENDGFRVIMFSPQLLAQLKPSAICMLVCSPETIAHRVEKNAEGRPSDSLHQTQTHATIQVAVATNYAFSLGVPAYFLESDGDATRVVPSIVRLLQSEP
jgi:adenylate kinase